LPAEKRVHTSDGPALAVHDFGGSGPDLLLAHATGLHGMVWAPVVEHLTDRFRCVSFDERGHGHSGRPGDGDFHWRGFAADALTVVDALGLDHPYGAGHSCGGAALLLAEEDRPGTFSALWCYEPVVLPVETGPAGAGAPGDDPGQGNHLATGARRRRERFPSAAAAYRNFAGKPPFDQVAPEALQAYVDHGFAEQADGTVVLRCRPDDEAETYVHSRTHDAFARLGRVACPVTLVWGERTDSPFGATTLAALAARLGVARLEPAPGLGHFGPLEDPGAVARSITSALGSRS
jgi:pimeloyl-ACP methyl ester carboxylesterase